MKKIVTVFLALFFCVFFFFLELLRLQAQTNSKLDARGQTVSVPKSGGGSILTKLEKVLTDLNYQLILVNSKGENSGKKEKPIKKTKYRLELRIYPNENVANTFDIEFIDNKTNKFLFSVAGSGEDGMVREFKESLMEMLDPSLSDLD